MNRLVRTSLAALAVVLLSLGAVAAHAEVVKFHATLKGPWEVPPTTSAGLGHLTAAYDTDTHILTWHVEYSGLTGPVTAAHFHGPASETEKAGPQIMVGKPLESPINGTATLTDTQAGYLLGDKLYFNLHTAANPGGEVRGQVLKNK